jgi:hypothetical protein
VTQDQVFAGPTGRGQIGDGFEAAGAELQAIEGVAIANVKWAVDGVWSAEDSGAEREAGIKPWQVACCR